MKKIIIMILIVVLTAGCGASSMTNIDIDAASKALDEKYTNMVEIDDKELLIVYGLDTSLFEEYEIKCSQLMNGNFYALIKVSKDKKSEATEQMNNLFATLENQSNLYSPSAVKMIQNHLETSVGDYLIYLVSEDNDAMYNLIKEHIN